MGIGVGMTLGLGHEEELLSSKRGWNIRSEGWE